MQSFRIAYRNVIRQHKRSLLLAGAIAFGFGVFTLLNGFTSGLLRTVEGNVADIFGGHVYIAGSEVGERGREIPVIGDAGTLDAVLATVSDELDAPVAARAPRSQAGASVIFGARSEGLLLVGVDPEAERALLDGLEVTAGDAADLARVDAGLLLPEGVIDDLGIGIGESVIVRAQTINGQQNVADFVVVGATRVEEGFGIDSGYAPLAAMNRLLDLDEGQIQTLNLTLTDTRDIAAVSARLEREFARRGMLQPDVDTGGRPDPATFLGIQQSRNVDDAERWDGTRFAVDDLEDRLGPFTDLVGVMDTLSLVIFLVVAAIVMVGVTNAYRLVMVERTGEIGTLRAMGVQRGGIWSIFVWEAFLIALGGALIGLLAALLLVGGVGLIDLSGNGLDLFLDDGRLRFALPPLETLGSLLLICTLSVVAVLMPARAAARLEPAAALRAAA